MTESIASSSMVTSEDASPMVFIALKNATPSLSNFSMDVPPRVNTSAMDVPIVVPPISSRTSISSSTPSNDPDFIPDAFLLATDNAAIKLAMSSPILTKLSPIPSPTPPINSPIIVPILPASCSRTGSPVSRNFCRLGNSSINAPTAVAITPIAPISMVNAVIAVTPSIAKGATSDTFTRTSAIIVMNVASSIALVIALSTMFITARTPTNANRGIAIVVKAIIPAAAAGQAKPMIVNIASITVQAPASTINAFTLDVVFSIPLISARIPTNANKGTAIKVNASTPFNESPILEHILLRIIRTTDIVSISADIAAAELIADRGSTFCNK